MKLNVLTAAVILAGSSAAALAEDEPKPMHQFAANVALTTNYMFRGISQTDNGPAIQGGFDYQYTPVGFYTGVWASNIELSSLSTNQSVRTVSNRASMELDAYGGFAGALSNGITWDVGGIYYAYPGQNEDGKIIDKWVTGAVGSTGADYDYAEVYFKTGYTFDAVEFKPAVKAGVYYSPDYAGEDGDSIYGFGTFSVSLPMDFGLGVTLGYLDVDGDKTTGAIDGYDYFHYQVAITKTIGRFTGNLSWNDANNNCSQYTGRSSVCEGVVFAVSSAW